jgi:transcriptional regulator with XRE-family HTH domain
MGRAGTMTDKDTSDKETVQILLRLSKNIKEQRLARGLKQTDMSKFGFGYRWYQRLESGRHVPTLPTLIKLSRALEVELSDLFR